ncbi:MAG TPA: hypothetical protein VIQ31_40010 [Phormidium sp.]
MAKFQIFCCNLLGLWRKSYGWLIESAILLRLAGYQSLLSDRYQIQVIHLRLWQGVNSPPNRDVLPALVKAIAHCFSFGVIIIKDFIFP